MEEGFLSVAMDYGAAGMFIFYMVWQSMRSEKRQDAHLAQFMGKIELLRTKAEEDEKALRLRYDNVISGLNEERTQLRSNLAGKIKDLDTMTTKIVQRLDGVLINQETMLTIAKDQQTEAKARSAAASMVRQMKGKNGPHSK